MSFQLLWPIVVPTNFFFIPVAPLLLLPKLVLPSCWFAPLCPLDVARSIVTMCFNVTVAVVVANVWVQQGLLEHLWCQIHQSEAQCRDCDSACVSTVSHVIVFVCWVPHRVLSNSNTLPKVLRTSLVTICTCDQCHCHMKPAHWKLPLDMTDSTVKYRTETCCDDAFSWFTLLPPMAKVVL